MNYYEMLKDYLENGVEILIEYGSRFVSVTKINETKRGDLIPIHAVVFETKNLGEAKRIARNFETVLFLLTSEIVTKCVEGEHD